MDTVTWNSINYKVIRIGVSNWVINNLTWNSINFKVTKRSVCEDANIIDSTYKNKSKCLQLEEIYYLSSYVRKLKVCGSSFCIYYDKSLNYRSTGKKELKTP